MPRPFSLTLLAASLAALAGCGGSSETSKTIDMQGNTYRPRELSAKVGDRITWRNLDGVIHNVITTRGSGPRSQNIPYGGRFTWTATQPGRIDYMCTIHPGMAGELDIKSK